MRSCSPRLKDEVVRLEEDGLVALVHRRYQVCDQIGPGDAVEDGDIAGCSRGVDLQVVVDEQAALDAG